MSLVKLEAEIVLAAMRTDPVLCWEVLSRHPPVVGPWEEVEEPADSVERAWSRSYPLGPVKVYIMEFEDEPKFKVSIRSEVNDAHFSDEKVASLDKAKRVADADLIRRGYLLHPGPAKRVGSWLHTNNSTEWSRFEPDGTRVVVMVPLNSERWRVSFEGISGVEDMEFGNLESARNHADWELWVSGYQLGEGHKPS